MKKQHLTMLVTILAMLVAVAGCGSGDNAGGNGATNGASDATSSADSEAASASVGKATFIKTADAICEKADEVQKEGLQNYAKTHPEAEGTGRAGMQAVVAVGLPPIKDELEELEALGTPKNDRAELSELFSEFQEALKSAEENPESLLRTSGNPFAAADKRAAEYGFKACNNAL